MNQSKTNKGNLPKTSGFHQYTGYEYDYEIFVENNQVFVIGVIARNGDRIVMSKQEICQRWTNWDKNKFEVDLEMEI